MLQFHGNDGLGDAPSAVPTAASITITASPGTNFEPAKVVIASLHAGKSVLNEAFTCRDALMCLVALQDQPT